MRFLFDHDVPENLARVLAREGHEVARVANRLGRTATDREVFEHAKSDPMVLVTCNRDDFVKFAREVPHPGIIIVIRRQSRSAECAKVLTLLEKAGEQGLASNVNFA